MRKGYQLAAPAFHGLKTEIQILFYFCLCFLTLYNQKGNRREVFAMKLPVHLSSHHSWTLYERPL